MTVHAEAVAGAAEGLSGRGIPYRPGGDTPSGMDCQGMVEYCLRAAGLRCGWKGSNAMWRDLRWKGTPEACRKTFGRVPRGALLFIVTDDGGERARGYRDGLGNAMHVGIYTGSGEGAVHASASRGRVCASRFKGRTVPGGGWNRVGLLERVDYGLEERKGDGGLQAEVFAENGGTVNLRADASAKARVLSRVKTGDRVDILEEADGWARVRWEGREGYMMAAFLRQEAQDPETRIRQLEARVSALEAAR